MRVPSSLIAFVVCFVFPGISFADLLDERVAEIRKGLAEEIAKLESSTTEEEGAQRQQQSLALDLRQMNSQLSSVRGDELQFLIANLGSSANVGAELRASAAELAKQLPELIRVRAEGQLQRMNAVLERVVPACLNAKAEADLNQLLKALGEVAPASRHLPDPRLERTGRKVQAAIRTVSRWQDYLSQQAVGNPEGAAGILKSLLQEQESLIPRDEITARLPRSEPDRSQEEGLKLLASVQSLAELAPAIDKLHAWRSASQNKNLFPALPDVERLASAQVALQNGLLGEAFSTATTNSNFSPQPTRDSPSWYPELVRLRGILLRAVVPRILELEETPELKPEEDAATYLLRVAGQCVEEKRYAEASRVLATYRTVAFGRTGSPPEWLAPDIEGLRTLAAGEQLAGAGSIVEAIKTLRKAVTTVGRLTPIQTIQARLKQLETDYPEQANAATKSATSDQPYDELKAQLLNEMQRMESRLPPDVRARMRPQQ